MSADNIPSNPPAHYIGRYRIVRELARSNDIVYEATDPTMNRRIAIKQLNLPGNLSGEQKRERIERFKREAKAAGTLNHRNIVTIYEIGQDKELFFIAMEFLSGQSLRNYMSVNGPLPVRMAMQIALEMCDALGYAHSHSVIHRDVKPDNLHIVPPNNSVKLTDFGIARVMEEPSLTATGQVFGTPSYMSPEQLSARKVDHRTDLFSLGVMLYEILTGRKPFHGDNIVSVTYQIMNAPVTFPAGMPAGITAVLRRALAKDPDQRYQNAAAMAADIRSELMLHDPPHVTGSSVVTSSAAAWTGAATTAPASPTGATAPHVDTHSQPSAIHTPQSDATQLMDSDLTELMATGPTLEATIAMSAATAGAHEPSAGIAANGGAPQVAATTAANHATSETAPEQHAEPLLDPQVIVVPERNNLLVLIASITLIVVLLGLMTTAIVIAYRTSIKTNERVAAVNAYDQGVTATTPTDAIAAYTQAIKLAGDNSDIILLAQGGLAKAYVNLGDSQYASGDKADALTSYQFAAQNDSGNAQAHYGMAELADDDQTRLNELDIAIRDDPTGTKVPNARAEAASEYSNMANQASANNDPTTARSDWMRVIDLLPPDDPLAEQAHQRMDEAGQ